jgi:hypothetical protein
MMGFYKLRFGFLLNLCISLKLDKDGCVEMVHVKEYGNIREDSPLYVPIIRFPFSITSKTRPPYKLIMSGSKDNLQIYGVLCFWFDYA